jgi:ABC-type transport system involved in multi-copper enzyme maturation permease subunit
MSTDTRAPDTGAGAEPSTRLAYGQGVRAVFELEMKQRLRSRGWYGLLVAWFAVIAVVTALAAYATGFGEGVGQMMFELVMGFVLLFGLLVAPALSANSITGDRASGTLAVLQNTLLTPGQLLWGKWVAAWVASLGFLVVSLPMVLWAMSFGDVHLPAVPALLGMTAVELGVACAIGVGVSARASRTLFAVMSTYLLVALLGLGTLIGFGLGMPLVAEEVRVAEQTWPNDPWSAVEYDAQGRALDAEGRVIADQDAYFRDLDRQSQGVEWDPNDYVCSGSTYTQDVFHTERITWLLAANPFVVVADAAPTRAAHEGSAADFGGTASDGPMASISSAVRLSQAGPAYQVPCIDGVKRAEPLPDGTPSWPLGLGLQMLLASGLVVSGRRRLATPAGRLTAGTRVA